MVVGWLRSRAAVPTVVALRTRFERVRQAELERLAPRLAGLGPEARARVDEITRLMVEKLLLTPTEQLKASTITKRWMPLGPPCAGCSHSTTMRR